MNVNSTTGVTQTTAAEQKKPAPALPGQELGKDAFLKILVAQLRNQDPLNPTDSSAMVAQLAQFTSLEQMQNLNQKLDQLVNLNMLGEMSSLIGREVSYVAGDGELERGVVESILWRGSTGALNIKGEAVLLNQLVEIGEGEKDA